METINPKETVYNIIRNHPEVKDIMVEIGLSKVTQKAMLETVGRVVTLEKGMNNHNLDLASVKAIFAKYHYHLEVQDE